MAGSKSSNYFAGIIDGTGPGDPEKYKAVMQASPGHRGGFCWQLFSGPFMHCGVYAHGPSTSGEGMKAAIGEVLSEAKNAAAAGKDIILIGYSRGALACLIVAQRLKALNINVHSLVLLDPVDRYLWSSPYKLIPRNVLASFRAYRKLSLNVVLKYEGTIPSFTPSPSSAVMEKLVAVGNMMAPSNPFRPSFSSTIQGIERGDGVNPNDHARYDYVGSHGAMGGVGYEWVTEDPGCEASLIRDLTQWLADRIDAKFVLVPNYDPDLTAAYMKVGSVRQALTAAASAAFDMRLMSVGRLDAFIYKLRELSGI